MNRVRISDRDIPIINVGEATPDDKMRVVPLSDLRGATMELCSCGGAGPGEGCIICELWHMLVTEY